MRGRRVSLALVALTAAAFGAAGCGDDDGGSSEGPIRVGISLPLTGLASQPGKAAQQGYEVWQAMVNENGGLLDGREVELVIRDDASNQNMVTADYNALISREKVDLLLGTFSSLLNAPASAVAERNRMLFVEPAGGAPELFERGFEFLFFAQQSTADRQGDAWAEWVTNLPQGERPQTAAYPSLDDPFSTVTIDGIREKLEAAGIRTVYEEVYPQGTSNLDAIANTVKASDPDLVVHGAGPEDGVSMIRSFRKLNFTPGMLYQTTAPSLGNQYADAVGVENTQGIMYGVSHSAEARTTGNEEFVAKYREMFGGGEVPEDAGDAYAAAQVVEAAVKAVGSVAREDQLALADWLRENEVETILGPLSWDEAGRPQGEFMVGQWQNGKPEIVLPEAAATTDEIISSWEPQD
ncbi:MAG: ABC transporter substrate-binding protein [Solirubrobacterales bacterium]|nr:ABC transporter substrate-binding protein [Solirubrobacterales bacterium]